MRLYPLGGFILVWRVLPEAFIILYTGLFFVLPGVLVGLMFVLFLIVSLFIALLLILSIDVIFSVLLDFCETYNKIHVINSMANKIITIFKDLYVFIIIILINVFNLKYVLKIL